MNTNTTVKLYDLMPGHLFSLRGTSYVLVQFNRTRAKIARLDDNKPFVLGMDATVAVTDPPTRDDDALAEALAARPQRQDNRAPLTLRAGTKVRFVDHASTRKAGLVGQETVIVKVNTKTYGLANGYNVTGALVEEVS